MATYVSSNQNTGASTSISVSISSAQSNDLLVVFVLAARSSTVSNPTAGWTLMTGDPIRPGTSNLRVYRYYKISDGSETSFTATNSSTFDWRACSIVVRDLDTSSPFVSAENAVATSASTLDAPAVTNNNSTFLIAYWASNSSSTSRSLTHPGGSWTQRQNTGAMTWGIHALSTQTWAGGTSSAATASISSATAPAGVGVQLAITDAASSVDITQTVTNTPDITVAGEAATVTATSDVSQTADTPDIALTSYSPTVSTTAIVTVNADLAEATLTGQDATVSAADNITINTTTSSITIEGLLANVDAGTDLEVEVTNTPDIAFEGIWPALVDPNYVAPTVIEPDTASLTFSAPDPLPYAEGPVDPVSYVGQTSGAVGAAGVYSFTATYPTLYSDGVLVMVVAHSGTVTAPSAGWISHGSVGSSYSKLHVFTYAGTGGTPTQYSWVGSLATGMLWCCTSWRNADRVYNFDNTTAIANTTAEGIVETVYARTLGGVARNATLDAGQTTIIPLSGGNNVGVYTSWTTTVMHAARVDTYATRHSTVPTYGITYNDSSTTPNNQASFVVAATVREDREIAPDPGSITFTAYGGDFTKGVTLSPSIGTFTFAGGEQTIDLDGARFIGVPAGAMTATGHAPEITTERNAQINAITGQMSIEGKNHNAFSRVGELSFFYVHPDDTAYSARDATEIVGISFGPIFHGQTKTRAFRLANSSTVSSRFIVTAESNNEELLEGLSFSTNKSDWSTELDLGVVSANALTDVIYVRLTVPTDAFIGDATLKIDVEQTDA